MTLEKISIDNNVRYVKKSEQIRESKPDKIKNNSISKKQSEQIQSISGGRKSNTRKNNSVPRKQNKNLSQNNKKFMKNIAAKGVGTLTK